MRRRDFLGRVLGLAAASAAVPAARAAGPLMPAPHRAIRFPASGNVGEVRAFAIFDGSGRLVQSWPISPPVRAVPMPSAPAVSWPAMPRPSPPCGGCR